MDTTIATRDERGAERVAERIAELNKKADIVRVYLPPVLSAR
jgi:hypothetical protein